MSRKRTLALLSGLGGAVLIVVLILVVIFARFAERPVPPRETGPPERLTPEEAEIALTPHRDGSLGVSMRLVFDVAEDAGSALAWTIGETTIGWKLGDDDTRYVVRPVVSEVSGVELVDGPDGPAEVGALSVERDVDASGEMQYRFRPPADPTAEAADDDSSAEAAGRWSEGRHAVDLSWVLDDVHVNVLGRNLLVVPLGFPTSDDNADRVTSVSVEGGADLECLAGNRTFEAFPTEPACGDFDEFRVVAHGQGLQWWKPNIETVRAIAFDTPDAVTASPSPVEEES